MNSLTAGAVVERIKANLGIPWRSSSTYRDTFVSEEQGMLEMAQWVKAFIPEIPVLLIRSGEPFWAPE